MDQPISALRLWRSQGRSQDLHVHHSHRCRPGIPRSLLLANWKFCLLFLFAHVPPAEVAVVLLFGFISIPEVTFGRYSDIATNFIHVIRHANIIRELAAKFRRTGEEDAQVAYTLGCFRVAKGRYMN